ncbi:uncharacterized protein LOC114294309 isoform X2 [Camellia sinensis]|uniref:uncharacterized protein LOC114294309 isoform X2 n=1 Tax=Camellia sinensis TaxID=4442 RepID=UPI0010355606|nr:uncharacterized protein LOC114294309 isoform X2 [Camellia sinensis]
MIYLKSYKKRRLVSLGTSSSHEDIPETHTNLSPPLLENEELAEAQVSPPESQIELPKSQPNPLEREQIDQRRAILRNLAPELAQILSEIPQKVALGVLMAFPFRGVPYGTDEVITFPSVASSPEESAIPEHAQEDPVNSDHVREAPIDLPTNSDSRTSLIDRGSPVHEHVFEPDDNLLNEVDRADTKVLDDESTSSVMRVPQPTIITSITQSFPIQTEISFQTSLTADMGVQNTLAQIPSREILGTSTSPHIATELSPLLPFKIYFWKFLLFKKRLLI